MKLEALRSRRLASHRLTAPTATPTAAAEHMLAVQAQEFWGGRWAVAARSRGDVTLSQVDAAFDRGLLVRSWTMRGTLHIVRPQDLGWMLSVTADRQRRQYGPVHRSLGLDPGIVAAAERAVRPALSGGNRLTRSEFADVLAGAGIDPGGMRGNHLLSALALHLVVVWGPIVAREGAASREQYLVLAEDWIRDAALPSDPLAEMFVRFIDGHGPAGPRDFAWWSGLPLGSARDAASRAGERIRQIGEELFVSAAPAPRRPADAPRVFALPPFEEYYLSYADREAVCAPEFLAHVGPSMNGIVKPVIVVDGEVAGVWTHSMAVGRHLARPAVQMFADAQLGDDIHAAVDRFARFVSG